MQRGRRILRFIGFFAGGFLTALLLELSAAPRLAVHAILWLMFLSILLIVILWHEVAASSRALKAHNYAKARQHARNFLSCMPWLRWLKPLMRLFGATRRDPEAMALNNLGAAEIFLEAYDLARRHLEAAMRREPAYALPQYNMGLLLLNTGSSEGAKPWFEEARRLGHTHKMIDQRMENVAKWVQHLPVAAWPEGGPDFTVRILNDDKTSMDFVIFVLERIFMLNFRSSKLLMLEIHQKGWGICGTYSQAQAEAMVAAVHDLARKNEFPLTCEAVPAG